MKKSQEISTRIIGNIEHMLKFPKMWFHDPECMEHQLMYLTNLLSFIHEKPELQYSEYLVENGYQADTFSNSLKVNGHLDAEKAFTSFPEFFNNFFIAFKATLSD